MAHSHTEAFSLVKVDALLKDVDWNLTDGRSERFEYVLPDGTKADYVLGLGSPGGQATKVIGHWIRGLGITDPRRAEPLRPLPQLLQAEPGARWREASTRLFYEWQALPPA
jgi:hypothetical protein